MAASGARRGSRKGKLQYSLSEQFPGLYWQKSRSLFLAHAEPDQAFARRLAAFLEFGCDVSCAQSDGLMRPGQDLIDKAAEGFTAHSLVLLLSKASCPTLWPRRRWEPVLFEEARNAGVDLLTVLVEDCPYPALLRRRNFVDATGDPLAGMRLVKRWIWRKTLGPERALLTYFSADLENMYRRLADRSGLLEASGPAALRFMKEAGQEFEAVLRVLCHRRSLAQIAGDLGAQLGLRLEGTAEENCRIIRTLLSRRRCLLALDSPAAGPLAELVSPGRSSTLITREAATAPDIPDCAEYTRWLLAERRYAEAYEALYRLLQAGIATEYCARELTWICEQWGRIEEANSLRFHYGPLPSEQLTLF